MIFERDVTSKGFLANPRNQMVAFEEPVGKKEAPYSDAPVTLNGGIPGTGENVFYEQKRKDGTSMVPVLLEEVISTGGAEGAIYKVMSGTKCAKIFKAASNSELKMKKIALMCSKYNLLRGIDTPIMERISWPERVLLNASGEPVGYLMRIFEGTTPFSDFNSDTFGEIIPNVNKTHQVTMAVNLAEIVDFVHHNNIILCDINRGNILFDNNLQAFLVDLDSAQVADQQYYYPSNVGVPEFLSPEHVYDKDFSFLRTKADDIWILQMLLFHMLTPDGDPMLSSEDVKDEREIIARGLYPYQAGDNAAEDGIKGTVWHKVVSHFPPFIKRLFWESLNGKGKNFRAESRLPSVRWLDAMVSYQEILPKMIESDPESGKFIPDGYKKYVKSDVKVSGGDLEELLRKFNANGSGNTPWDHLG